MHHRRPAAVLLRILRHRPPLYLHLKLYLVTALVSLFLARPVSRSGKRIKDDLQRKLYAPHHHSGERVNQQITPGLSCHAGSSGVKEDRESSSGSWRDAAGIPSRWRERFKDLASVSQSIAEEERSIQGHPSTMTAKVRLASDTSPEIAFLEARRRVMLPSFQALLDDSDGTDRSRPPLQPDDLPLIAIGGSGGGFRAMLSFAGFLHGCSEASEPSRDRDDAPLLDLVSYLSGVSGSCWTLSSLYTHCNLSTSDLVQHYLAVCQEECHPMSMRAFDTVARAPRGNYWLFAPLVKKARQGGRGGGLMELYATLTSSYLLLPRVGVHDKVNLNMNMSSIGWSRVFEKNNLQDGRAPLPILTAARIVVEDKEAAVPPCSNGRSQDQASTASLTTYKPKVEWWEFSPLEVGSADLARCFPDTSVASGAEGRGAYIPTTSFGPRWKGGHPASSPSELPLSLILGHCTSAPAGPLTGYISALLSTLPAQRKTVMRWALEHLNRFLMMRRWRKRWGNPIRSSKEWNPFFGMRRRCVDSSPIHAQHGGGGGGGGGGGDVRGGLQDGIDLTKQPFAGPSQGSALVDSEKKIKLIDAGVSNNLPAHIFYQSPLPSSSSSSSSLIPTTTTTTTKQSSPRSRTRSRSRADIFIGFDASSDVHSPLSLQRIQDFGRERGLKFWFAEESEDLVERWERDSSFQDGEGEGEDGGGGGDKRKRKGRRRLSLDEYLDWYRRTAHVEKPNVTRRDTVGRGGGGRRDPSGEEERSGEEEEQDLSHRSCIVLSGYHSDSFQPGTWSSSADVENEDGNENEEDLPDLTYIYIPLLPVPTLTLPNNTPNNNKFNPNTSPYATVYNLLWTRPQAHSLLQLSRDLGASVLVRGRVRRVVWRWVRERGRMREREEE